MTDFDSMGEEILGLLYGYTAAQSCTGTDREDSGSKYFLSAMGRLPYFTDHPEMLIHYPIPEDPLRRAACCAVFRGDSPNTIVMIHHSDVTDVEDYGRFADIAFDPDAVTKLLSGGEAVLEPEVRDDLNSGDFLCGHGVCDMKGGAAIQMAMMAKLSAREHFPGTLIVLAVPDEENLSAGMRAAVTLLRELKDKLGLHYQLMINSEPHQRKHPEKGVFSIGSIGKLLPFVYAKGRMSHAGKAAEGINPLALISRVVAETEGLPFADDGAPAPTWLMLRDDKEHYDVSMPRSAFGCMSVLMLRTSPEAVLDKLRGVCLQAFSDCLQARSDAGLGRPWEPLVYSWTELCTEAERVGGERWKAAFSSLLAELQGKVRRGEAGFAEACRSLLELSCRELPDVPLLVYGFMPPYYPAVTNSNFGCLPDTIRMLPEMLGAYAEEHFHQEYDTEEFYTGISDLSYGSFSAQPSEEAPAFIREMPMYGNGYELSFEDLREVAMPCINIGPWGKDFHKLTERVCISDLTKRTPELLYRAIELVLGDLTEDTNE